MRRSFLLLLVSVALNGLLVCGLLKQLVGGRMAASKIQPGVPFTAPGAAQPGEPERTPNRLVEANYATWDTLFSEDPRQYAAQLRLAGCPELTVRAILVPRLAAMREEQLAAIRPVSFWASARQLQEEKIRVFRERTEICSRFDALGKEIIGVRWVEERTNQNDFTIGEALFRFLAGPTNEENWDDFLALMERGERLDDEISELPPVAALHESRRARDWFTTAFNQILSQQEQIEFNQRLIGMYVLTQDRERSEFEALEMKRISAFMAREVPGFQLPDLLPFDSHQRSVDAAFEGAIESVLRQCLTSERFTEWKMRQDNDFHRALGFCDQNNVPEENANYVFETKLAAERKWMEVLAADGSETEKEIETKRIQSEARQSLSVLPPALVQALEKSKPYWLPTFGEAKK